MVSIGSSVEIKADIYHAQYEQLERAYAVRDPVSWRKHPLSDLTRDFLSCIITNFQNFPDNKRRKPLILDIGCGAGEKTDMLRYFSLNVMGVDYSENAIVRAWELASKKVSDSPEQEVVGRMCLVRKNLFEWHIRDSSFDGAHDYLTFLHIMKKDWSEYLNVVHRILRTGAPLLIVTFSGNDPDFYGYPINQLSDRGIVFNDQHYHGDKTHVSHLINSYFYFPREEELRETFSGYFDVLQIQEIPHPLSTISNDHRDRKLWHMLLRKI